VLVGSWAFFFCATGRASLLTSLGFGGGLLQRLGNVLACEAWAFSCP